MRYAIRLFFPIFLGIIFNVVPAWAGNGYLDVTSEPDGVSMYVNGSSIGRTPISGVELPSGKYTLEGKKNGFGTSTNIIEVGQDQALSVNIRLIRSSGAAQRKLQLGQDFGSLLIINKIPNTEVFIDGDQKGMGTLKIAQISTGVHEVWVGPHAIRLKIYKSHLLKVQVDGLGFKVLNDKDEAERNAAVVRSEAESAKVRQKEEENARQTKLNDEKRGLERGRNEIRKRMASWHGVRYSPAHVMECQKKCRRHAPKKTLFSALTGTAARKLDNCKRGCADRTYPSGGYVCPNGSYVTIGSGSNTGREFQCPWR